MAVICKQRSETLTEPDSQTLVEDEKVIICRVCSQLVTKPELSIRVNDAHAHVFANPHGNVFEIGCFSHAPGCVPVSQRSDEFTWFPGYSWTIGACAGCGSHLGWIFSGETGGMVNRFYGLILDKLIFP
ncbi:cereblon family protein [uncultured Desulfobacter sp.]|uniref:cereblon family protein n=1 Tax=uncultured Desulfobacter sp. TaxID=240139 RepID=UPI002AABBA2C|nr:cereblon family protein [uncultured Desulfobacter sp.]